MEQRHQRNWWIVLGFKNCWVIITAIRNQKWRLRRITDVKKSKSWVYVVCVYQLCSVVSDWQSWQLLDPRPQRPFELTDFLVFCWKGNRTFFLGIDECTFMLTDRDLKVDIVFSTKHLFYHRHRKLFMRGGWVLWNAAVGCKWCVWGL